MHKYSYIIFYFFVSVLLWEESLLFASSKKVISSKSNAHRLNDNKIKKLERRLENLLNKAKNLKTESQRINRLIEVQDLEIKLSKAELEGKELELKEIEIRKNSIQFLKDKRVQEIQKYFSKIYGQGKDSSFSLVPDNKWKERKANFLIMNHLIKGKKGELRSLKELDKELVLINRDLEEKKNILLGRIKNLEHRKEILALNKKLNAEKIRKNKRSYSKNLKSYQEVIELKKKIITASRSGKLVSKNPPLSAYRGKLKLPAFGKVIQGFGKKYDKKSNLYTFHKGIRIGVEPGAIVRSIFPGRVVYSGRLGGYRQLVIVDHGKEYYSLVAQLGELSKKEGDKVSYGDILGRSSSDGSPLYFELRKRHIALDPKPWFKK